MSIRFPLSVKILGWFFLNVIALGLLGWALLAFQFHLGPEILLSGRSGERLRAMSQTLNEELKARPREEWSDILARFGNGYGLDFRVYGPGAELLAGTPADLPPSVKEKLAVRRPGPPRDPNRPEENFPRNRNEEGNEMQRMEPPPGFAGPDRERRPRGGSPAPVPPAFLVKSSAPKAGYWFGLRLQPPPREGRGPNQRGPEFLMLVIYSPTLSAGGLIVDFSVWLWVALGAFLFSVLFWAPLIYNITRSIRQMTAATAQMAEGRFEARVDELRRDELGTLAHAINQMAGRLDGFVSGQKRFTGDIAHELCSPIARMQMAVSIMESQSMTEPQRAYLNDVREDVELMSNLVNELLAFSKAALAGKNLRMRPVDVAEVVAKAVKIEAGQDGSARVDIPANLRAMADADLLFRAVANVIRNSIKYAGDQGEIAIAARLDKSEVELAIRDNGPGVPEGDLPKLFDPFYRVDLARARETGGSGLGLAIVKSCINSCGGKVSCRNLQPRGFEVSIRLPASEGGELPSGEL
jgi:two-component system sensor histidine kinase CpxA